MPKMSVYDAYFQAIKESSLGYVGDKYIKDSLHEPDNEGGGWNGWSDGSLLVIDHEHGLPGAQEYFETEHGMIYMSEVWIKIDERASKLLGRAVFSESYNYAITGVYDV